MNPAAHPRLHLNKLFGIVDPLSVTRVFELVIRVTGSILLSGASTEKDQLSTIGWVTIIKSEATKPFESPRYGEWGGRTQRSGPAR